MAQADKIIAGWSSKSPDRDIDKHMSRNPEPPDERRERLRRIRESAVGPPDNGVPSGSHQRRKDRQS